MLKRALLAACVAALSLCAHATDYTDIWWVGKSEDGWGINLAQSDKFIFATFFVYGPGNVPTWYAGNLTLDATGTFAGGLYSTTGTYFGTVPYNPAQYTATQVGNASFKPTAADKGVLTYNVGGVSVVKNIQRQQLTRIPLGGSYTGAVAVLESACTNAIDNGPVDLPVSITVIHPTTGPLTLLFEVMGLGACSIVSSGTVTQNGALYSFSGTIACTGDTPYALTVSELKATSQGIEGHWTAPRTNDGCQEEGRFSGARKF